MEIILKTSEGEKRINVDKATHDELREWVNQAPDEKAKTLRKKLMYVFLYSNSHKKPESEL
jgi:Trm5-related predicted tRNA methylase